LAEIAVSSQWVSRSKLEKYLDFNLNFVGKTVNDVKNHEPAARLKTTTPE